MARHAMLMKYAIVHQAVLTYIQQGDEECPGFYSRA